MDKYDRLKLKLRNRVFELEALKRTIEAAYPDVRRLPADRSHKTWMRQAIELRKRGRLN